MTDASTTREAADRVAAFLGSRYSSADPLAKVAVDTGPGVLDYYVVELRRADLLALVDAVRLVPAPGPDTEAGARKLLAELVELKDGPRDAEYRRVKPQVWQKARELLATARGEDPLTEDNGDEWFRRRVARYGPCTCGDGPWDVCQEVGGCALCTALPTGWPCVAEGGYGAGSWAGARSDEDADR